MSLKTKIYKSTENFSAQIERLKSALETADAIVIGAGAGLSTSAGFTYSGERFQKYFLILQRSITLKICIRVG